jgi:hypothetical protein
MDGAVKTAAHALDWKFTTSRREVGLATMLKKISSPSVGNVIARSIRNIARSEINEFPSNSNFSNNLASCGRVAGV